MPLITLEDWSCAYRLDGPDDAPVLMLSHSLGLDHTMWDPQAIDLARHLRVLRYDTRGHGASSVTSGEYTIAQLGADALGLADALSIDRFAFCGLSMGGMIGLWLGVNAPGRLTHLVIANSSARPDATAMEARRQTVLRDGMASIEDAVMGRFFSPGAVAENPPHVAAARRTLGATNAVGYAGCAAAVRDMDLVGSLDRIRTPTLVIGSDADPSLPWEAHSRPIAEGIAGASSVVLHGAHISNLESPREFSEALMQFLLQRS